MNVISPDVVEVSAGVEGKGSFSISGGCDTVEVKGCVGPPGVFGKVTLGGWIEKKITHTFEDVVACY